MARDISLNWDKPLMNANLKPIKFTETADAAEIPILLPNESISTLIDGARQLFQVHQNMNYTGEVLFQDASGQKYRHRFFVSAEKFRNSLVYLTEDMVTQDAIQKIPKELEALREEIKSLGASRGSRFPS